RGEATGGHATVLIERSAGVEKVESANARDAAKGPAMPPLQVYSTLTRKQEPFPKRPGETVTMYVCGPTVYKPSHIGHMVGPVIFDTVKRYLSYLGYKVQWVVNITDVDDKLINRAKELNTTVPALAKQMTEDYFD